MAATMSDDRWAEVDRYIAEQFAPSDPVLDAVRTSSLDAGLPEIQVSPVQGKLLELFVRLLRARRVLEIGTLGGYSAIWMARALPPDGRLVTLELEPRHAEVARRNFERAGLSSRIELIVGPALESLEAMARTPPPAFDLTFIDADKKGYPDYFDRAVSLTRPGGLIVIDNVVRGGAVTDPLSPLESVQGVRRLNERMAQEPMVSAVEIQTVGAKGYDGFALAWRRGP